MDGEELKELFGTEALTYDAFAEKLKGAGTDKINLVNLAKGGYVDTQKHAREVEAARKTAVVSSKEYTELAAERDKYKTDYDALMAENLHKENVSKVAEKVSPDFVDFIYDKVAKTLAADSSGKTTFEQALDAVLKELPQYKKSTDKKPPIRLGSSPTHEGGSNVDGNHTASQSMTAAILKAAGRTPKN